MANADDTGLKAAYRASRREGPGGDHPDAGTWERFAGGELSDSERVALMDHVVRCTDCSAVHRALLDLRREARTFDPAVAQMGARTPGGHAPWVQWRGWFGLALAAMLLLAIAASVALWPRGRSGSTVARNQASPGAVPTPPPRLRLDKPEVVLPAATALVFRGRDADAQQYLQDLGAALQLYRANDYARAISRLTALRNRYPDAGEPPFYLGASRLLAGDPQGAIESFERAAMLSVDDRRDAALWYLAVAQERAGLVDAARRALQDLCSRTGPRQASACAASAAFGDVNPVARP